MNLNGYFSYDAIESSRLAGKWFGATVRTFWGNPVFGMSVNPLPAVLAAWGEISERSFDRIDVRPDWGIDSTVRDGRDYLVNVETVTELPFGRLLQFKVSEDKKSKRTKILLIAPMSGHYATLLRGTVTSLLPDADVYVAEWRNARNVPVSAGKFDIEDFTKYLITYFRELGPDTHVVAVCQPVPLTMAATAWLSEHEPKSLPASLTLLGGPVDPLENPTSASHMSKRFSMAELERMVIMSVGGNHVGVGRKVYPGSLQLASFMMMNPERHASSFANQVLRVASNQASDFDRHNVFYDEYLAVMDITAEFYLSTVHRVFQKREIARNKFTLDGALVDIGKIKTVPVKIVEGGQDDISAPGQCAAALQLLTGLPERMKAHHIEAEAGHYGLFNGRAWHQNIRPLVLDFMRKHSNQA